jgi:hypothetical protein
MSNRTVPKLNREELLVRLSAVFYPERHSITSSEIDTRLLELCVNCPDPVGAMDAVLEAPHGVTCEQLLAQIQAMPTKSASMFSSSELAADHPLRSWRLDV